MNTFGKKENMAKTDLIEKEKEWHKSETPIRFYVNHDYRWGYDKNTINPSSNAMQRLKIKKRKPCFKKAIKNHKEMHPRSFINGFNTGWNEAVKAIQRRSFMHEVQKTGKADMFIPAELLNELEHIAESENTTVLGVVKKFMKIGLIMVNCKKAGDKIIIEKDGEQREIVIDFD